MESVGTAGTVYTPPDGASVVGSGSSSEYSLSSQTSRKRSYGDISSVDSQEIIPPPSIPRTTFFEMSAGGIFANISSFARRTKNFIFGGGETHHLTGNTSPTEPSVTPSTSVSVSVEDGEHVPAHGESMGIISSDEQQSCELSLNTAKIYTGRTALLHVNDETDDSSLQSSDQPEKLKIVLPNHIASANEIKTIVAATQQLPSPQLSEDESPRESSPPPPGSGLFQKPKPIGVSRYLFQESGKPFYPKAETPKQRSEILKASVLSRDRFDNDRIRRQPRAKYPSHFAYKQSPSTPSRKRPRTFATPISTMGASNSTPQWYNAINQPSNRRAAVSSVTKPQSKRGPILQKIANPNSPFDTERLSALLKSLATGAPVVETYLNIEKRRQEREKVFQAEYAAKSSGKVKPLGTQENEEYEKIKKKVSQDIQTQSNECYTSKFRIEITYMDLGKVVGQLQAGWLNDNIIDYYLGLITERAVANGVKVACHLCCFHAKLKMDTGKYNYSAVSRWAKRRKFGGKDLLGMEYIFIPINLNESHWTLGVMNIKDKRFEYYDSMRDVSPKNCPDIFKTLRQYFEDETGTKPTNWIDWGMGDKGPRQENYSDCGLFLLKTAEVIARGANLDFDHHDINIFRKWVTLEVYDGQLKHV